MDATRGKMPPGETWVRVAITGVAYWLAVVLAVELVNPVAKIALFWPANAIAAAALILGQRRDWPLYIAAAAIAYFVGRVPSGHFPAYVYVGLCLANTAEFLIVAVITKYFMPDDAHHRHLSRMLPMVMLAGIPACIVSGAIGSGFVASALAGAEYWATFAWWFTSDLSGMLLTLPPLIAWLAPGASPIREIERTKIAEAIGIALAFAAMGAFVFHGFEAETWVSTMFPYFVFPFLGWAALRLGLRGTTAAILAVGLFAIWLTYIGHGPFDFQGLSAVGQVSLMKAGLITIALTTVFLAVVMADRHYSEQILKESHERDRRIFESIPFGVSVVSARNPNRRLFVNNRFVEMLGASSTEQALAAPVSNSYADVRDLILTEPRADGTDLVATAEMLRVRLDGSRWWCRVHRRRTAFENEDAIVVWHEDVTARKKSEDMLRAVAEGVSGAVGVDFFDQLVEYLARTLEVDYAVLGSVTDDDDGVRIESIAVHAKGMKGAPFSYDLAGTPCEKVIAREGFVYPADVQTIFPDTPLLREMGVEGYVGAPLFDSAGQPLGIIAVLDGKPLEHPDTALTLLEIFAARAGAEVERARAGAQVRQLAGAMDGLSEIFALYDADDRMVMCNKTFREINPTIADTLQPGVPYEVYARATVENGLIDVAHEDRETWLHQRIERHRNPGEPFEVKRTSGQWFLVREERLPDGATATLAMEITEIKRAEEALRTSEARFKDIAEATSDWIWETDSEHRFSYFSDRRLSLLNLDPVENLGMTRWQIAGVDPETNEFWRDHKAMLDARLPFRYFQYEFTTSDGRTLTINVSGKPVFDETGQFTGYRGTATDITETTRAEKALHSAQQRFRTVVDNLPAVVNLKDRDRRFIFVNKLYREWYGIEEMDVLGMTAEEVVVEDESITLNRRHQETEVLTTGRVATREETKIGPDGTERHVELIKFPIVGADDDDAAMGTIEIDVTDRKNAEASLRKALIAAEDANQAKSDFLATMSHEFRTPLNAILGFADILKSQYMGPIGDSKYLEYASDIRTSGLHLLALVNDLLDLTAIEAGKRLLSGEQIAVGEIVEECVKLVQSRATDTGVNVRFELPTDLPPLYADRRAVRQILLNLLSNAVKFTDTGGSVAVSASGDHSVIVFRIDDTGIGIPADKLSRLTEPFAQIETDPYRTRDGWGLGLTITQSLVDLHGGTLDITSTPGKGTSVTVTLPSIIAAPSRISQPA